MKNLLVRTITGCFFVSAVIASLFLPSCFFYALFLIFTLVGTWEYLKLSEHVDVEPQWVLPLLLSAAVFSALLSVGCKLTGLTLASIALVVLLVFLILTVELYRQKPNPVKNVAVSVFSAIWVAFPLGLVGFWRFFFPESAYEVLALFVIIWAFDSLAYCSGSLFGKHPLFKRVSPKKSWEGTLISLLLTSALSSLFYFIPVWKGMAMPLSNLFATPWYWIGFALVIIVASSFGDLVESLFKRNAQIKDSGKILPGHGGVLDRFDSLFLAAPLAFLYRMMIYFIFCW